MVRFYDGADGLKTGNTDNAQYCMAVTAKRDGMRLIAIVLGEADSKVRNSETSSLLDYGFNMYRVDTVKKQGEVLGEIKLDMANKEKVKITPMTDALVLNKKNDAKKEYKTDIKLNNISLPLKKGTQIGTLIVKDGDKKISEVGVTVLDDVNKTNIWQVFVRTLRDVVTGDINL